MDKINIRSYAKVNLALDVLGKLENGYHQVRMVMQTIQLYDKLELKKTTKPGVKLKSNLHFLPVDEKNIAYAAAKMFLEQFDLKDGVFITLEKWIPVSAGMAGGSGNAAAVLKAMNELFQMNLSLEELQKMGIKLGADVPYCLLGGTALSEGIGEILTPLPPAPGCYCLIVKPKFSVSTEYVYQNLKLDDPIEHPDIDGMLDAIYKGSLYDMAGFMGNVLEAVTANEYHEIYEIKQNMKKLGALNALMSGSGPTVFGLYEDQKTVEKAFYQFKIGKYGKQTYITEFLP